jgi:hypothetical protein
MRVNLRFCLFHFLETQLRQSPNLEKRKSQLLTFLWSSWSLSVLSRWDGLTYRIIENRLASVKYNPVPVDFLFGADFNDAVLIP